MVRPPGIAPSSADYQSAALLLSYGRKDWRRAEDLRLNRRRPVHLFSKQCPRLGGFTLQSGGEQWSCPTSLAARIGFQPITALRGFTLQENGGGERSCSPSRMGPIRFKRAPAPRPVSPPQVPAAGFAPASIRLEGGGLSFSATRRCSAGARKWRSPSKARVSRVGARLRATRRTKWTSRRDSHPQHGVRSAA